MMGQVWRWGRRGGVAQPSWRGVPPAVRGLCGRLSAMQARRGRAGRRRRLLRCGQRGGASRRVPAWIHWPTEGGSWLRTQDSEDGGGRRVRLPGDYDPPPQQWVWPARWRKWRAGQRSPGWRLAGRRRFGVSGAATQFAKRAALMGYAKLMNFGTRLVHGSMRGRKSAETACHWWVDV